MAKEFETNEEKVLSSEELETVSGGQQSAARAS